MRIRVDGGRQGCAGGAAVPPARRWPAAGRGAGAGPSQRVRALPCETEFRTGKTAGGFCGFCFPKGLEEKKIESRVAIRIEIKNRAALAVPFRLGRKGKNEPRAPVRNSVPNGEKVRENHPRNSVSRVAKWRWLRGLCRTGPGRKQALAGNPAVSPEQTTRWTKTNRVGGRALGRPAASGRAGCPRARSDCGLGQHARAGAVPAWGGRKYKSPLLAMEYAENQKLGKKHCPNLAQPHQTKSNQIKPKKL